MSNMSELTLIHGGGGVEALPLNAMIDRRIGVSPDTQLRRLLGNKSVRLSVRNVLGLESVDSRVAESLSDLPSPITMRYMALSSLELAITGQGVSGRQFSTVEIAERDLAIFENTGQSSEANITDLFPFLGIDLNEPVAIVQRKRRLSSPPRLRIVR